MTIIAAVDFSPISARAAGVAQHWADRMDETLMLVHVVLPPHGVPEDPSWGSSSPNQSLKDMGKQQLAQLQKGLSSRGVPIFTKVLLGRPDEALAEFAAANAATMVVLGTHGRSSAARFFLGSVAERVVKQVTCPVLVVPESALEGLVSRAKGERVRMVAALGDGPAGEAVRAWLREFRERHACDVTFVHVFDAEAEHARLGLDGPDEDLGDHPEVLALLRREFQPLINLPGVGKTALVIRSHAAKQPEPLSFAAATDEADLIVVGTWSGHRLGTRTGLATVRAANVPVLCVPSPAVSAEKGIGSGLRIWESSPHQSA